MGPKAGPRRGSGWGVPGTRWSRLEPSPPSRRGGPRPARTRPASPGRAPAAYKTGNDSDFLLFHLFTSIGIVLRRDRAQVGQCVPASPRRQRVRHPHRGNPSRRTATHGGALSGQPRARDRGLRGGLSPRRAEWTRLLPRRVTRPGKGGAEREFISPCHKRIIYLNTDGCPRQAGRHGGRPHAPPAPLRPPCPS